MLGTCALCPVSEPQPCTGVVYMDGCAHSRVGAACMDMTCTLAMVHSDPHQYTDWLHTVVAQVIHGCKLQCFVQVQCHHPFCLSIFLGVGRDRTTLNRTFRAHGTARRAYMPQLWSLQRIVNNVRSPCVISPPLAVSQPLLFLADQGTRFDISGVDCTPDK